MAKGCDSEKRLKMRKSNGYKETILHTGYTNLEFEFKY